ncbi:MAG TPA: hypothetical protein VJ945_05000 [Flavobacteriaceae bacterium]|nr:hypothetical protein [Flavobacteriaceae bacterium]
MKAKLLLLFFIGLIFSCANDDETKIAGLDDFSGNYKLSSVTTNDTSLYCIFDTVIDERPVALEITSNGRFKLAVYLPNSNNNNTCTKTETLEGQITITGSFYGKPNGTVEYDNSEIIDHIFIEKSVNGVHNKLNIEKSDGSGTQYWYVRAD